MLAKLKGLFTPEAIAKALAPLPPLETTMMDNFFKNRPTHPLPVIGVQELTPVVQTVPVVRRDGTPIAFDNEAVSMQFIAPLPVKVKIPVTASELNDLKVIFGNQAAVSAWRIRKVDQIRKAVRDTTEGMCAVVATTGKLTWPVELDGGGRETYEVDYGSLLSYTPAALLTTSSKLPDVYKLLRGMELVVKQAGLGGNVEFWAGSDVVAVLLGIVEQYVSTTENRPYRLTLEQGKVCVGNYVIHFMDETYPSPEDKTTWLPKMPAKAIFCVATNQQGSVWYCAIDSISNNNQPTTLHIVPVVRDDDSGIMLIGQAKPLPARPSKATCKAIVVA
ncbi:MAG: major capsid protein [Desulfovibrionaceae bacterium]|nr:major capsid protein [Desulfovibrionaceae bacterium]